MPQEAISNDPGRDLIAAVLLPTITHLAVGDGAVGSPTRDRVGLAHELGRTRYLQRQFVVEDPAGPIAVAPIPGGETSRYRVVTGPTNLIYFRFRFLDTEAQGDWNEYGLFAGDVTYNVRSAFLTDGPQAGDDRAGVDILLSGTYAGAENQTLTVTVGTGGGSGVAKIGWTSSGSEPAAVNQTVTFGVPIALGATGLTITFDGGDDGVLTLGDQFRVRCLEGSESAEFAAGGVYDPVTNEAGQVASRGDLLRLWHVTPPEVKAGTTVDVQFVIAVLQAAAA